MKHLLFTVLLLLFSGVNLEAQQFTNEVVSSGGGSNQINNLQLDWTLGELAVHEGKGRTQRFTEGFHQPIIQMEWIEIMDTALPHKDKASQETGITLYPNPVSSELTIHFSHSRSEWMVCQVFDANGIPYLRKIMDTNAVDHSIDLSVLAPGLVFVQFIPHNGGYVTPFTLVKIQ